MRRSTLETEIQRQIELAIGAEPDLLLLRNSVGLAKYFDDKELKEWKVPYGLGVGSPDLVAILAPRGTWFCLEVKCPGEKARPEQEKCHRTWKQFGAFVAVVHGVDEARAALKEARGLYQ